LNTTSLHGRKALVTGASRGIGKGIALALASSGADVVVNFQHSAEAANKVVEEIRRMGRTAFAIQASVDDPDQTQSLISQAASALGGIDLLISNAGIVSPGTIVADTSIADFDRLMRIHAMAPFYLVRSALPHLRARTRSDVIIISSSSTRRVHPGAGAYTMAKSAAEMLGRVLAIEERNNGVRVNMVAPGLTETDMAVQAMEILMNTSDLAAVAPHLPFGRIGRVEEVAEAVRFLASDANSYATGELIYIDGGGQ
jgi:NAD(P)-dependent dehydrogenase (short-subunit alcohol dehydrogenase family)